MILCLRFGNWKQEGGLIRYGNIYSVFNRVYIAGHWTPFCLLHWEEDEDGPLAQGARDLVGMFLPKVVADQGGNALSCYIRENLSAQYGEHLDERG